MEESPEYASVEAFGEFLLDEGRTEFSFKEAETLAEGVGHSTTFYVIRALKVYGFTMSERAEPKRVRGMKTSSNDRWFGPGSSKSHGGSGGEQISGFAGQKS